MSFPLVLRAAPPARPPVRTLPRREASSSGSGALVGRLITGGALLEMLALAAFASLRCLGLLNLDTMTLLPAAACAGAAVASLGVALACLRALRGA